MCALFGFLNYGKRVPWKILQKLVQALANASEVRGHHAVGIAYNKADTLTIFKRPKLAHKLHFRIPQGTAAVMGHTRLTTQGDQKFNQNNHPFRGKAGTEFALAHNGVLYNDDQLRRQLNLPDTQIETKTAKSRRPHYLMSAIWKRITKRLNCLPRNRILKRWRNSTQRISAPKC